MATHAQSAERTAGFSRPRPPTRAFASHLGSLRSVGRKARGFTLVELMVALTGGLVFSIFVFSLTANVSRFYQQQTTLADATMATITGFQRLTGDVQRAGYLATPNFALDPKRCPVPDRTDYGQLTSRISSSIKSDYPQLERMALARVDVGAAVGSTLELPILADNGIEPDFLYLYGNFTSADSFPVRGISNSTSIVLDPVSPELLRAGFDVASSPDVLAELFPAGRIIRVYDPKTAEAQFSVIAATNPAAANGPTITLRANAGLAFIGDELTCGLRGEARAARVNTVNIIRYGLADLSEVDDYSFLFDLPEFEGVRTEFVRQEINPATQTASLSDATVYSTELVAEFAVDFKVGIVAMTSPQLPPGTPLALQSTDGTFLNYAGDPTSTAAAAGFGRGPHLIRALVPRLSVRERLPSRDADVDTGATPDGLFRISLQTVDETPTDFARVRTLQTHVMTRNARNVLWQ